MDALYYTEDGCEVAEIRSGVVLWPNGLMTKLDKNDEQSVSLTIGNEKFDGIVSEGEIQWSDGTKWIASVLQILDDSASLGSGNSAAFRQSHAAIRHTRFDLFPPAVALFHPSPASSNVGSQGGSPLSMNAKYLSPSKLWDLRVSNMAFRATALNPWTQEAGSVGSQSLLSGPSSPNSLAFNVGLGVRSSTAAYRHTAAWKSTSETPNVSVGSPASNSPLSVTSGSRIQPPLGIIRGSHAAQRGTRVAHTMSPLLFSGLSPTNRAHFDPRLCSPASSLSATGFQSPKLLLDGSALRDSKVASRGTNWFLPTTGFASPSAQGTIAPMSLSDISPVLSNQAQS